MMHPDELIARRGCDREPEVHCRADEQEDVKQLREQYGSLSSNPDTFVSFHRGLADLASRVAAHFCLLHFACYMVLQSMKPWCISIFPMRANTHPRISGTPHLHAYNK